jgi:hypothetical protein
MWNTDVIEHRKNLIRVLINTNGGFSEAYLLSLPPFEVLAIEMMVAEIINPKKPENEESGN